MGKITPRLKTLLVLVTFLGFTNFILSETNLDLRKIVQKNIFTENFEEDAPVATNEVAKTSETRKKITPFNLPAVSGIKMSAAANAQLEVTLGVITPATCDENSDGGITINVSGGVTPYTYSWSNGATTKDLTGVPAGTYSVTVTDANNQTQSLNDQEVKVEDNISPNAIAKDITVQLDANGNASITADDIDNGSNDACGIASLSINNNSFTCSDVGPNTVTLTVTDNNGNTSTATATVTVEDKVAPVVNTKNLTIQLDANGTASIAQDGVNNGSTDACGAMTFSTDKTTFTCSDKGNNTVTLTVTDSNGNSSTGTAIVTVEDNVAPVVNTKNIAIQLDASGQATITAADVDNNSSDACGITSMSVTPNSFTCSDVGPNTVTLTVIDNNGNTSTGTATITVEDKVAPVVNTKNITVQLDASGQTTITAADVDNNSSDACGITSMSVTPNSFDCSKVGANTVTLTVTDSHGNSSTGTATVTVKDNVAPVVNTKNITVQLDANGTATILQDAVNNGSTDSCGELTFATDITSFNCSDVGTNTVTLTVTDGNGNSASKTATVTVEDNIIPVIAGVSEINTNTDTGLCTATVAITTPAVNDNCTVAAPTGSRSDNKPLADPYPTGETIITWTATDAHGNVAVPVTQKVIVKDNEAPVPPQLSDITWGCAYSVDVPVATDNCDNEITATANRSTTFSSSGEITWTFTDAAGNSSTAKQLITINPISVSIQKQDIVCFDAANGTAEAIVTGGVGPFTYNWGSTGSTSKVENLIPGTYSVTVTDANGCDASAQITITQPDQLQADFTSTNVSCSGNQDGVINITNPGGGFGNYEYSINGTNWQQSGTFFNLNGGGYSVQIREAQHTGCVVILASNLIIDEPQELLMTEGTSTPTTCFGASDGTATAGTVSGGNGDYQYSIDNTNFSTSTTFTGLPAGTHTIFLKDSKGCSLQKTVTVTEPAVLNATVSRTNVSCFEGSDGKITITSPTGGSGSYEFSINGSNWQTSGSFAGLSNGTFNVQIRDRNATGCVILLKENYPITQPAAPLTVEVTTTRTSTYGTATGSATANPSGGTAGYTFEWRKKGTNTILQTTKTATNLLAGTYELTVKDKNGCTLKEDVIVIDKVRARIISASECLSVHDMIRTSRFKIDIDSIAGGVGSPANFIYEWKFGKDSNPDIATGQGEFQVTYSTSGDKDITLTVTDEASVTTEYIFPHYVGGCFEGCGTTSNFEINTDNFFIGDKDGNPLTGDNCSQVSEQYLWMDITKNANGYSLSAELNYSVNDGETTYSRKAIGCFSELLSGTPGGNGQNKPEYAQIPTGLFRLFQVVTSGNDASKLTWKCGESFSVEQINIRWTNNSSMGCNEGTKPMCYGPSDEVEISTPLIATAYPEDVLCKGENSGSIIIIAAGGIRPYQYSITGENGNYKTSNEFYNLPAGTYDRIWVKDSRGKKYKIASVNILEPENALTAEVTYLPIECFNGTSDATASPKGGTPFVDEQGINYYEYLWNDALEQTTAKATGLTAGDYTVTVIDAHGCQTIESITITQPEQLSVAEAGDNQSFNCGFNSTFLEANTPETGVGTWSIISGAGGTIVDASNPNSEFTGGATTYTLRWTIAHADGTCKNEDEVQITFVEDCSTLDFDGVDDHVVFGNNYNLNSGTFSMEAWVKLKSINGVKTILSKRNMRNPGEGGYGLVINQGAPTFRWGNSSVSSSSGMGTQRWYHIAVIFKDSRANLYVDGIRVGNAAATNPAATSFPFMIGAEYDNNNPKIPKNYFHGWIEEVRIWNTALTEEQLRFMMNQRLEVGANPVKGDVLPLNVPGNLAWSSLSGYYQLLAGEAANGITKDKAASKVDGLLKNITTPQENTAPLPYISVANGTWRDRNIWAQPVVWDVPNSTGINGENINWNIAKINQDIISGGHDINVLGLLSEGGTLKIANPNETGIEDWKNSGQALRVSHYLKLNGNINLVGESQLIQTDIKTTAEITNAAVEFPQSITSVLDETSKGYIERAQQGTANSFNYNYWSSPVSLQGAANNSTYTVKGVMMDGSSTPNYGQTLDFHNWHEFADGAPAVPRKISNYWIHKFRGTANVYSEWVHIGSTGTLLAGEGYTMKGTAGNAAIEDRQNYLFKGKPNNGTIALTIGTDQNYLLGNPYPSAIDVNAFILENLKDVTGGKNDKNVFNGAVYFWDHFAGKSHILLEYIGGYATRNLLDGVPAISNDQRVNANDQQSNKIPGRYIPVAQGFFINTTLDAEIAGEIMIHGGDVKFKNSQRAFVRESTGNTGNSLFLRPEQNTKSTEKTDDRAKIRLDFKSPMKFNRQILVGVDPNTTDGFDLGYDAPLNDNSPEDMFWMIGNREFVIQGVPDFNLNRILPLGILIQEEGDISISINKLENIEDDFAIFLFDKEANIYFDLRNGDYEIEMKPGYYSERFAIVFQDKTEDELPEEGEEEEEEEEEEGSGKPGIGENPGTEEPEKVDPEDPDFGKVNIFYLTSNQELVVKNPDLIKIESILMYSLSGQVIEEFYSLPVQKETRLPIRSYNSAVYTVKLLTERGLVQKKIIINN